MNSDVMISLIKQSEPNVSDINEVTYAETATTVFAKKKSVRQSEFFQAAALGFKPDLTLEIYDFEYDGQELCELSGERYRIYRTYSIPGTDRTELYLTALGSEIHEFA